MNNPDKHGIWIYEECQCCGQFHLPDFSGDCRDDANRFTADQLDAKHGDKWRDLDPYLDMTTE